MAEDCWDDFGGEEFWVGGQVDGLDFWELLFD